MARTQARTNQTKEKLIRFLDRRVFDPILRTSPEGYSPSDQEALRQIQEKTRREKERFRHYPSAAHVREQFLRKAKLRSAPAAQANRTLEQLGLPRMANVQEEFFQLSDRLGVQRGARIAHRPHRPHPEHKKTPEAKAQAERELERIRREERARRASKRRAEHAPGGRKRKKR